MVKLFVSYSHKDEILHDALEGHLAFLKNQGVIDVWYDRRIEIGQEFATTIDTNLSDAQIILLLVSSDFLASPYCWGVEMTLAMKRHESGAARVIPIILRACDWRLAPFGKLLAAPKDGKPVKSWPDLDEALYDVVRQIRIAVEAMSQTVAASTSTRAHDVQKPPSTPTPEVYCSRCGAPAGTQSICSGSYTYHQFSRAEKLGAYCSRCGVSPGEQTICTGSYTYHNFLNANHLTVFCTRCGAYAGKQSICTGSYTYHSFAEIEPLR